MNVALPDIERSLAAQGFVDGLNDILLIGARLAFATAVASFALIRERDYAAHAHGAPEAVPA